MESAHGLALRCVKIPPPDCMLSVHTVPGSEACQAAQSAEKQSTESGVDEKTCTFSGSELVLWVNRLQTRGWCWCLLGLTTGEGCGPG